MAGKLMVSLVVVVASFSLKSLGGIQVAPLRKYSGLLEERAQKALIIVHGSKVVGKVREGLILKIDPG